MRGCWTGPGRGKEAEPETESDRLSQGRSTPIFRPVTFFTLFWHVEHVLVYIRGASPLTQAESRQSQ